MAHSSEPFLLASGQRRGGLHPGRASLRGLQPTPFHNNSICTSHRYDSRITFTYCTQRCILSYSHAPAHQWPRWFTSPRRGRLAVTFIARQRFLGQHLTRTATEHDRWHSIQPPSSRVDLVPFPLGPPEHCARHRLRYHAAIRIPL